MGMSARIKGMLVPVGRPDIHELFSHLTSILLAVKWPLLTVLLRASAGLSPIGGRISMLSLFWKF